MTVEEIAKCYSACLDSVNLINKGKPESQSDADWEDSLDRNKRHLALMLTKEFWTDEDLTVITDVL